MPRKRSKAFWNNFKFKYKLTIINENTLEEIVGLRVSKLNGLSVLLSVLAVLFLIAACIIAFTPLRNYLPGYMNSEVRSQIVDNALRVDSLQELLNRQNLYIMNIQDIFSGKVPIDSVQTLDSLTAAREDTLMERTRREEEFRRQYEENEKYNLTTIVSQPDVNGLILYRRQRQMCIRDRSCIVRPVEWFPTISTPIRNTLERILPPTPMKACWQPWTAPSF